MMASSGLWENVLYSTFYYWWHLCSVVHLMSLISKLLLWTSIFWLKRLASVGSQTHASCIPGKCHNQLDHQGLFSVTVLNPKDYMGLMALTTTVAILYCSEVPLKLHNFSRCLLIISKLFLWTSIFWQKRLALGGSWTMSLVFWANTLTN